jgi:hypothetical protein
MAEVTLEDTRIHDSVGTHADDAAGCSAFRPPPAPTAPGPQASWSRIWRRARRSSREMCIWE